MRIALLMKLGAATAGGLIALACAWTLVCVIAFTRVLEGVERRHGRSFDEAHPGWASRNGEARIGGANGANPRPRRVGRRRRRTTTTRTTANTSGGGCDEAPALAAAPRVPTGPGACIRTKVRKVAGSGSACARTRR